MKDIFKEQLVKKRPTAKMRLAKGGIIFGAFFLVFLTLMMDMLVAFAPLLFGAIALLAFFALRRLNVEFEYALTNHELDIDIIYNKSRRKRRFSGSVRDIEAFRPLGSREMEHGFSAANMRLDFALDTAEGYEFLINQGGKKLRIAFSPNPEILTAILPFLKRGTYPAGLR